MKLCRRYHCVTLVIHKCHFTMQDRLRDRKQSRTHSHASLVPQIERLNVFLFFLLVPLKLSLKQIAKRISEGRKNRFPFPPIRPIVRRRWSVLPSYTFPLFFFIFFFFSLLPSSYLSSISLCSCKLPLSLRWNLLFRYSRVGYNHAEILDRIPDGCVSRHATRYTRETKLSRKVGKLDDRLVFRITVFCCTYATIFTWSQRESRWNLKLGCSILAMMSEESCKDSSGKDALQ